MQLNIQNNVTTRNDNRISSFSCVKNNQDSVSKPTVEPLRTASSMSLVQQPSVFDPKEFQELRDVDYGDKPIHADGGIISPRHNNDEHEAMAAALDMSDVDLESNSSKR